MARFTIAEILKATSGRLLQGGPESRVDGVTTNSRNVKRKSVFIAIIGEKHDAHKFISDAVKQGAGAVIVSRKIGKCPPSVAVIKVRDTTRALGDLARFHRLRFSLPVIAITGSAGKTTTKEMIAAVLGQKYKVLKNTGTENNQFGVPLTVLRLEKSHQIAVLEVGTNRPGDIAWLASIVRPSVAVMTNIGESHLALLKNKDRVFREKFGIVKVLPAEGTVIYNGDDPYLRKIPGLVKCKTESFGVGANNKIGAEQIAFKKTHVNFKLDGAGEISLPGTSSAQVANALAAISCARLFKVTFADIKKTLKKFSLSTGRQTYIKVGAIGVLNDTYNANPVSFRCALEALRNRKNPGRKILICADMLELGNSAGVLHRQMGILAAESGVDAVVSFGKLSRLVSVEARRKNPRIETFYSSDRQKTEDRIKTLLRPGDFVLVKGSRGMATERFVTFIENHF